MIMHLTGGTVIFKEEVAKKDILFDSTIKAIHESSYSHDADVTRLDVTGLYVAPGFIDAHIHGSNGADVMDGTLESIETISCAILKNGTTRFLPTTMTMATESIQKSLINIKAYQGRELGAKILGVHLEGPFISKGSFGAQNPLYIQSPNLELIKPYLDLVKIVTYAPEEDHAFNFTHDLVTHQITPSIGHTCCSYETACEAIHHGAKGFTHLFNAMTGLHHRKPGAVGAALNTDAYVELIADGIHVHPHLFKLIEKLKTPSRMLLVTDAMRAACLKDGVFDLGGQPVHVKEGVASLADGTLAGSVLNQIQAVKNMKENTELSLSQIIQMVTLTPATYVGVDDVLGSIEIGKIADFVVFDEHFNIHFVICEGKCLYRRDRESN